jgi:hypothetical protein
MKTIGANLQTSTQIHNIEGTILSFKFLISFPNHLKLLFIPVIIIIMTDLYDLPLHQPDIEYDIDSSDDDEEEEEEVNDKFEMAQYDLDVVDEALLNPHNKEFMDHFGFKIQVKTDDEGSSDEDTSDEEQESKEHIPESVPEMPEDNVKDTSLYPEEEAVIGQDKPVKRPTSVVSNVDMSRPSQTLEQRRISRQSMVQNRSSLVIKKFFHHNHKYDSERQTLLKQEALDLLSTCKDKEKAVDWGNIYAIFI